MLADPGTVSASSLWADWNSTDKGGERVKVKTSLKAGAQINGI